MAGARVGLDKNNDGDIDDAGEFIGFSDSQGNISLPTQVNPAWKLISIGGTDLLTGNKVGTMTAQAGSTVVTPLTTLIASSSNPAATEQALLQALGVTLPPGQSLATFDPISVIRTSSDPQQVQAAAKLFEAAQAAMAVVQAATAAIASSGGTSTNRTIDVADLERVAARVVESVVAQAGTGGSVGALFSDAASQAFTVVREVVQTRIEGQIAQAQVDGNTALVTQLQGAASQAQSNLVQQQSAVQNSALAIDSQFDTSTFVTALQGGDAAVLSTQLGAAAVAQQQLIDAILGDGPTAAGTLQILSQSAEAFASASVGSPSVRIITDANNDGFVNFAEWLPVESAQGSAVVRITLPDGAGIGDEVRVVQAGTDNTFVVTLTTLPPLGYLEAALARVPEGGTYQVTVTLSRDGQPLGLPARDVAVLDRTSPSQFMGVTRLDTNATSPVISGFAVLGRDESLQVTVAGKIFTEANGLAVIRNSGADGLGTWSLTLPAADAQTEGYYDVQLRSIDAAGNATTRTFETVLQIDRTPPTVVINNVSVGANGIINVENATTNGGGTEISGSVSGEILSGTAIVRLGDLQLGQAEFSGGSFSVNVATGALIDATDRSISVEIRSTDAAGNPGSGTATGSYTVDLVRPTATLTVSPESVRVGETVTVTLTFSEPVTGTLSLIPPEGFSGGPLEPNADGTVWTAVVTADALAVGASNTFSIRLGDNIVDLAGNAYSNLGSGDPNVPGGETVTSNSFAVVADDSEGPTATVALDKSSLKAGETALVTITFTEPVTGFDSAEDVTVQGGVLSVMTSDDDGVTWTGTFTPDVDLESTGNVISLAADYQDATGNSGSAAQSDPFDVDTRPPTASIVIGDEALTLGETATVTVTFSEAVPGFDSAASLIVQGGVLSAMTTEDDGVNWTGTFTPGENLSSTGNVITLSPGFTDAAGNAGFGVTSNAFSVSTVPAPPPPGPPPPPPPIDPTVNKIITTDGTPRITGTLGDGDDLQSVTIDGITFTGDDLVVTGTQWSLNPSTAVSAVLPSLAEGDPIAVSVTAVNDATGLTTSVTFDEAVLVQPQTVVDFIASDVSTLVFKADSGYQFAPGTDVSVTGTAFLSTPGAANAAAFVFQDADVTVGLTGDASSGNIKTIIDQGDSYLDGLTEQLTASGIDRVSLTDTRVSALVASNEARPDDLSFGGGIDIVVQGTNFLGTTPAAQLAAAALFDPSADVTVAFGSDLNAILALGTPQLRDQAFDEVVSKLQAANVDTIEFTAAQIGQLAANGITINALDTNPLDVVVNGTSFLGSSSASLSAVFADTDVNVTVRLQDEAVDSYLNDPTAFDTVTQALDAAGVDAVELDVNQTLQLADAGLNFTTGSALDVVVQGTQFMQLAGQDGVSELFSGAPVSQLFLGGSNSTPPPLPPFPSPPGADASLTQALSQVDAITDSLASAAYAQLGSADELFATLSEIGFGPDATVDSSLANLMSALAQGDAGLMGLQGALQSGVPGGSAGSLLEGLAGGLVHDSLDPFSPGEVAMGANVDPVALLAQLAQPTGGVVELLGGVQLAPIDPFDPFHQLQKG